MEGALHTGVVGQMAVRFTLLVALCVVDFGILVIALVTGLIDPTTSDAGCSTHVGREAQKFCIGIRGSLFFQNGSRSGSLEEIVAIVRHGEAGERQDHSR